ncbi:MAG: flagellar biosynthetic protein FliO, partial [Miltoncostaeaceae bacterium]
TLLLALALAIGAGPVPSALGQGGADPAPVTTTGAQAPTAPAGQPAPAAEPEPASESLPIPEGSSGPVSVDGGMGGTALRLLLGLIVVVALIVGVWQLMKRVQRNRYPALAPVGGELIDVVATTPLGPNRALHLVRVGGAVVLVGATEQAVQAITTLDEDSAAIIARALGPGGPGEGDRSRAVQTARTGVPVTMMDRLRAMTVRR